KSFQTKLVRISRTFLNVQNTRKHHRTARKEIMKTNQQPHTWTHPDPGARSVGDCQVWGRVSSWLAHPSLLPSFWDLNGGREFRFSLGISALLPHYIPPLLLM
ncbi:mCG145956, partial [Mus musculus]